MVWVVLSVFWGSVAGLAAPPTVTPVPHTGTDPDRIAQIVIEIDDPWKKGPDWVHMARSLVYLNEGEQFSADLLQKSLAALKLSVKFRDIKAASKQIPQGMQLIFTLKPFHLIKKLRVQDNYPIFEYNIRNVMTVQVGEVYNEEEIERQKKIIAKLYREGGFIDPVIHIEAVQDQRDGNYILNIKVAKGAYYTLNRLLFQGNRAFSDQTLLPKMKIWRGSVLSAQTQRFSPRILEQDIKKLVAFYRAQQYPEIEIEQTVDRQPPATKVIVNLTVTEGPRYEVRFEGNKAFSDFRLRKQNVIFKSGNVRDAGLRKTVRNLRRFYREAGFLEATIRAVDEPSEGAQGDTRRIRIDISEGPQTIVESVHIGGNRTFDDKRISKQMLTRPPGLFGKRPYVPETLDEDIFMIKALYAGQGFLEAAVTADIEMNPDNTRAQIRLDIDEGVQTRVTSIGFAGQIPIAEQTLRQAIVLKVGDPFDQSKMQADADILSALVSEAGYPHVNLSAETEFSSDRTGVHLKYAVAPGKYIEMGEVFFTGNFRTKKSLLARVHGLTPGEPFSLQKTLKAQKEIRDMGVFDSVQLITIGLKEQTETVHFMVDLEEKKPYFYEVGVGYQSDRGVFARAKAGDRNLWGLNKDFWVSGEISEIGYKAETAIREPRLWGSKIEMTVSAFAEETQEFNQTFGTQVLGTAVNFARPLTDLIDAGLGFRFEQRKQFEVEGNQTEEADLEPRSNLVITPFVTYDTRDSFVRPRQGHFSELKVNLSKGIKNSTDDFTKYRLDLRYFTTPIKRLTLALMGRAGTIRPFGSNRTIPQDQLFYLGGINSVRGYDENLLSFDAKGDPVGGKSAINSSIEGRIDIGYNFELTPFFDTGSVIQDPDFSDVVLRSSFGMGLLYQTLIGPIGIFYGWKIDPRPEEAPGQWHFTIGYTF